MDCADYGICNEKVTKKHHKDYCLGKEYSYYQCYYYEQRHPKPTKIPAKWLHPDKIPKGKFGNEKKC